MLVKELIERLKLCNQEALVVRSGHEGGLNEIDFCYEIYLEKNVNTEWYYGKHEETFDHKNNPAVKLV